MKRLFHTNNVGFGLGIFLICIYLSSISLFLSINTVKNLPHLLFEIGGYGILISLVFDFLQKRRPTKEVGSLFLLLFIFGYNYLDNLLSSGLEEDFQKASYLSTLFLIPVTVISRAIYQAVVDDLMNIQEKKQYALKLNLGLGFGFLLIAATVFSFAYIQESDIENNTKTVLFSLWDLKLAPLNHNVFSLIPIAIIGCIWSILMLNFASVRNLSLSELQWSAQYINYNTRIWRLIKNKYFVGLCIYTICTTIATISFYAIFLFEFENTSKSEYSFYRILSFFFVTQVFFTFIFLGISKSKIVRQLGLQKILRFIPIMLLTFVIASLAVMYCFNMDDEGLLPTFFFVLVVTGTTLLSSLMIGLQKPILELYCAPIEEPLRNNTINLIEGIIRYLGIIVTGGILLGLLKLGQSSTTIGRALLEIDSKLFPWVSGMITIMGCIAWMIALKYLYNIYTSKLQDSLSQQTQLIKHNESFSESTVDRLEREIMESNFPKIIYQLRLLQSMDPLVYRRVLIEIVDNENENIQSIVISEVVKYQLTQALPILKKFTTLKNFSTLKTYRQILKAIVILREAEARINQEEYINQLTSSKIDSERLLGALLAQHVTVDEKNRVLNRLFADYANNTVYNAIVAAAGATNDDLHHNLVLRLDYPQFANASLSSIGVSGDVLIDKLEAAFHLGKRNQKLQQRIIQAYGKIGTEKAVNILLSRLRYPNQNVVTTCLDSLSRCGLTLTDDAMALQVRSEVEEVCGVAIWNMSAYQDVLSHGFEGPLSEALSHEIAFNYNTIFRLLALLYDPKTVESVKNNIDSPDIEEAEFASQLLDIFIYDQMKLFLIPMFKRSTYSEKIIELMDTFPTEPMKKSDLLISIIQKDYKWINSWTKTCALKELNKLTSFDSKEILVAQLINPNPVLREAAAESLLERYKSEFEINKTRYKNHREFHYAFETMSQVEHDGNTSQSYDLLKFDIIAFLSGIEELKDVPSLTLSEMARHITLHRFKSGELIVESDISNLNYYFVYQGTITLNSPKGSIYYIKEKMIHKLGVLSPEDTYIKLLATSDTTVMKIDNFVFEELFTFHEEIPNSILNYLNKSNQNSIKKQSYQLA